MKEPMKNPTSPILIITLTVITGLFITSATVLISLGKDITPMLTLIPVLATNVLLLFRVDKVEKNTNGNMSKLIDHALASENKNAK